MVYPESEMEAACRGLRRAMVCHSDGASLTGARECGKVSVGVVLGSGFANRTRRVGLGTGCGDAWVVVVVVVDWSFHSPPLFFWAEVMAGFVLRAWAYVIAIGLGNVFTPMASSW